MMQQFEYLALPAPRQGQKVKGLKTPADRFAHEVTKLMNDLAAEGWEYWRSECLPSEERKGLMSKAIMEHNLLIFRRPRAEALAEALVARTAAPPLSQPAVSAVSRPAAEPQRQDLAFRDAFRREPQIRPRRTDDGGDA